jgi:hypothetical protein
MSVGMKAVKNNDAVRHKKAAIKNREKGVVFMVSPRGCL